MFLFFLEIKNIFIESIHERPYKSLAEICFKFNIFVDSIHEGLLKRFKKKLHLIVILADAFASFELLTGRNIDEIANLITASKFINFLRPLEILFLIWYWWYDFEVSLVVLGHNEKTAEKWMSTCAMYVLFHALSH